MGKDKIEIKQKRTELLSPETLRILEKNWKMLETTQLPKLNLIRSGKLNYSNSKLIWRNQILPLKEHCQAHALSIIMLLRKWVPPLMSSIRPRPNLKESYMNLKVLLMQLSVIVKMLRKGKLTQA